MALPVIELVGRQALGVAVPAEFERVYVGISKKISDGEPDYRPGDRLPTIEQLAAEYKLSGTTVKTALNLLGRDGWTRGVQGKGTFVADHPPLPPKPGTTSDKKSDNNPDG